MRDRPASEADPLHSRAQGPVLVTVNVADFAAERDVVLVFVCKCNLPAGQAKALAVLLDRWAAANPDPYVGHHTFTRD
jgi:hypothetical protein